MDDDEDDPELADAAPAKQLYLLTQQTEMDVNISHFSVQDMFDKLPTETDLEIYKMKRVEGIAVILPDVLKEMFMRLLK